MLILSHCVTRQIVPETAYLYDAVHLYEKTLLRALKENKDPLNGREMIAALHGVHYESAMGYVNCYQIFLKKTFFIHF